LQPHRLSNTTNGTLRTWALELGMKDAAKLLLTTLDEEQATEIALTATATKVVNQTAEKRPDANTSPD
jgi:ferritin-like metal-binding protein YciE